MVIIMTNEILDLIELIELSNINKLYFFIKIIINILFIILIVFILYYLINIGNKHIVFKKKINIERKHYSFLILILLLIIIIALLYAYRDILFKHFTPIIWAIILSYLLNPVVHRLMEFDISRVWSVVIIYSGIFTVIILFGLTVTPRLTKEIRGLIEVLPQYTNEVFEFINTIYEEYVINIDSLPPEFIGVEVAIREYLNATQIFIVDFFRQITEKGLNFFSNIVSIVLIPIYGFYFLKDAKYFKRKIVLAIPMKVRSEVIAIGRDINKLLNKFIRGQLIIAAIVGMMSIIALLLLEVDFAFLIGTIAGIANIIPYFGPIIGSIPAVIVAFIDDPIKAIWVIFSFFIIQQIESAVLSPKIVGDSVGLHPVIVILVLLIGGQLFGLPGLLFAIPITASIKIILNHISKGLIKI